jgi:hypothetical protein
LQYGPALATARPTGSFIGTALGAAAEPTKLIVLRDLRETKTIGICN